MRGVNGRFIPGEMTEEEKRKISEGCKKNGVGKWMIGRKRSKKTKEKIREWDIKNQTGKRFTIKVGKENPMWAGDKVKYNGLHAWVRRHLGKPRKCEHCGSEENRMYNWANKSREYKRELTDWLQLCVPCHRRYDKS